MTLIPQQTLYLRGGLGTQVLLLYHAFSTVIEHGYKYDNILISPVEGVPKLQVDYVSQLFDLPIPCEIDTSGTIQKSFELCAPCFEYSYKHRERIAEEFIPLKPNTTHAKVKSLLHVRGTDNQFVSEEVYCDIARDYECTIYGDDPILVQKIALETGSPYLIQNPIDDWYTTVNAERIYGGLSTFFLSTTLIPPDKYIGIFDKDLYTGPKTEVCNVEYSYRLFEGIVKVLPNSYFVSLID